METETNASAPTARAARILADYRAQNQPLDQFLARYIGHGNARMTLRDCIGDTEYQWLLQEAIPC